MPSFSRLAPSCIAACAARAAALGLVALIASSALAPAQDPLPLSEVRSGQRGYGLSVFTGTEPEQFAVEVLGVLRNPMPDSSYILARLTGRNLEQTGVIAGMSGSPVYIDGKLAGAVSAAWPFSREAIALVTPIGEMQRLSELPSAPPLAGGSAAAEPLLQALVSGKPPVDLLERRLAQLQPRTASGAAVGLQWSAAGFGAQALDLMRRTLGGVAPAGEAAAARPGALVPGGAVAGVLVDGDLRLAVTGTITERRGDEVLAFGHPFLGVGPVSLPMAPAEVLTVLANQFSSFKIASFGEPVGAFDQDRQPGMRGRVGARAPMVPMTVDVEGRKFQARFAPLPQVAPVLVAITALGCLQTAGHAAGAQGFDLDARFRLAGHDELRLRQSFDGEQAAVESAVYLLAAVGFLSQNRLEAVTFEAVEASFTRSDRPRTAALVGAHADRTLVRPGDRVGVNLDLLAYRGGPFRRAVTVAIPADIPTGRYSLFVGDGSTIDAARFHIEPAVPETFGQALELLRSLHSRRDLVVLGVYGGRGLAVAGRVMPRLPGSIRSLWGAAASGSALPLRLAVAQQDSEALDVPIEGGVRIDLEVRRREPVAAEGAAPADGSEEDGTATPSQSGSPPAETTAVPPPPPAPPEPPGTRGE